MQLKNILVSKTIRFVRGHSLSGGFFLPDLSLFMKEKYRFVEVPTKLQEFDSVRGVKFLHGQYKDVIINALEIYDNGLSVSTRVNTNYGDQLIDEVLDDAITKFGFEPENIPNLRKGYVSTLEIKLDKDISKPFKQFSDAYNIINKNLSQHSDGILPVSMNGFIIGCDLTQCHHLKPQKFTLERRDEREFGENLYFSTSPLPTDAHLEVIESIEKNL